jgi:biopolymer transport protein ExbB
MLLEVAANNSTVTGELTLSLWDLAVKGGWIMLILGVLSLITIYVFVDRFIAIKNASKIDNKFMENIREYILEGKIDNAQALCKAQNTPLARMIEKGINRIGRPLNDINAAVENVGKLEIANLEKTLAILATVAGAAPMLGFLGTVTGMIRLFIIWQMQEITSILLYYPVVFTKQWLQLLEGLLLVLLLTFVIIILL